MGTVITNGEIGVAYNFRRLLGHRFFDARKCCFFPSQVLQLLSCPRNPIQCWKATPGSGPRRLEFRLAILWARGGPHAAGTSSNIFKRKKYDFFHRFFRDRSVRHKDSQSVIFAQPFLASNKRYKEEPPKILFHLLSCQRSYAVPGWGVAT